MAFVNMHIFSLTFYILLLTVTLRGYLISIVFASFFISLVATELANAKTQKKFYPLNMSSLESFEIFLKANALNRYLADMLHLPFFHANQGATIGMDQICYLLVQKPIIYLELSGLIEWYGTDQKRPKMNATSWSQIIFFLSYCGSVQ